MCSECTAIKQEPTDTTVELSFIVYCYENYFVFALRIGRSVNVLLTSERGSKQWRVRESGNSFISFRTYSRGDEQYLTNNGFVIWTQWRPRDNASSDSLLWKTASGRKITPHASRQQCDPCVWMEKENTTPTYLQVKHRLHFICSLIDRDQKSLSTVSEAVLSPECLRGEF